MLQPEWSPSISYLAEMGFLRGLLGGTAEEALDEALARPRETAAPRGLLYGKGSSSIESSEENESDRCSRSDIGGRKDGTSPWEEKKKEMISKLKSNLQFAVKVIKYRPIDFLVCEDLAKNEYKFCKAPAC